MSSYYSYHFIRYQYCSRVALVLAMQIRYGIGCTLFIKNIIDGFLHKYVVLTERGSVLLCISTTFGKAMSLLKIKML